MHGARAGVVQGVQPARRGAARARPVRRGGSDVQGEGEEGAGEACRVAVSGLRLTTVFVRAIAHPLDRLCTCHHSRHFFFYLVRSTFAVRRYSTAYPFPRSQNPLTERRNTAVATPRFLSLRSLSRTQAGLAIDPNNSGLDSSLTAAKEAAETDRRERWRKAGLERAAEEERLKKRDALKAKAKADAAEAAKAGATGGGGGGGGEGAAAKDASGDPLSSFFSEIQGEESKPPPPKKVERVLHDKYTNQELGTPKEQMDRLLQHNYKWKNLNAFETLQLGPDATVEDIKQR